MKQRIGLLIALLGNPKLLILDEPIYGLDSNGIIEIRELLKRLNRDYGVTIFLSSHLLAELERIVSHVGILHHGKLRFHCSIEELRATERSPVEIKIFHYNYDLFI